MDFWFRRPLTLSAQIQKKVFQHPLHPRPIRLTSWLIVVKLIGCFGFFCLPGGSASAFGRGVVKALVGRAGGRGVQLLGLKWLVVFGLVGR